MSGTFGYELDLGKLTEEEKGEIRKQIAEFGKYAPLIQNGLYYRLSNPFRDAVGAWAFVSEDQKEALLNVVMLENHANMTVSYVKLQGLRAEATYKEQSSGRSYTGAALMQAGIPLPVEQSEYPAYQMYFTAVEGGNHDGE